MSRSLQVAFNRIKSIQNTIFKQNSSVFLLAKRSYSDASSVSDRALFPGYRGEFNTNLEFIYPENTTQIECYRVMNRKGEVIDETQNPQFDKETCVKIIRNMIMLTKLDSIMYEAQRQGRISFYMPNHGESATQLGSAHALDSKDLVFAQYREAGVILWRGYSIQDACHQIFGNSLGSCKGRQMPIHYGSKELDFVTISSTIATQMSQAVGAAYAYKRKQNGQCVITYFGDGGSSEGDAHAAMNFAAVYDVPLIFFCRNNGYAISTSTRDQYRGDGIASRGPGYGMATIRVDGNDIFAVYNATKAAREIAIKESRPVLIEAMTYRLGHHSTSDDSTAYRSIDEMNSWEKDDNPIHRFKEYAISKSFWSKDQDGPLEKEAQKLVMDSLQTSERIKRAKPTDMFEDIYKDMPPLLQKQRQEMVDHLKKYANEYPMELYEKI